MGKIVSNFFISLDGVVESPEQWQFPYFVDRMGEIMGEGINEASSFLMGRVLYDEWSQFWPGQDQTEADAAEGPANEFAGFINSVPKHVVSNTLESADWDNTTIISGDVANGITYLKESSDGNVMMSGSATTVRWLLENGLLDELALLVHPIVVGHGQRLFEDGETHPLRLNHQETLDTGVLYLRYAVEQS